MAASKGKSNKSLVEIVDTLKEGAGNTTVYLSIREAARAIGCVHTTICKALKTFDENGQPGSGGILVKKRFLVKRPT